jgi:hypothetical protein
MNGSNTILVRLPQMSISRSPIVKLAEPPRVGENSPAATPLSKTAITRKQSLQQQVLELDMGRNAASSNSALTDAEDTFQRRAA